MDRIGDSSLAPSLFPPSWGSVERGAEKEAVPQGTWHMTGTWGLAIVQLSSTCQRWGFAFSWMKRVAEKGLWLLQMGPPMQSSINRCHSDVSPRQMMSLRPQWESRMFTPFFYLVILWFCLKMRLSCHSLRVTCTPTGDLLRGSWVFYHSVVSLPDCWLYWQFCFLWLFISEHVSVVFPSVVSCFSACWLLIARLVPTVRYVVCGPPWWYFRSLNGFRLKYA